MQEEFAVLLFFFGISMTANLAFGIGWLRANRRLRRLEDRLLAPPPQADDVRVERLEHAIDSMSDQMDQLANGQEFLNRMIAGRLEKPAPRKSTPDHEVTPR